MPTIDPQDVPSNADKFVSDTWTIVTTPTKKTPKEPVKKLRVYWMGGAGSGNFGHEGRPGEVGGSGPGGGSAAAEARAEMATREKAASAAFDAFEMAKAAHSAVIDRMEAKYGSWEDADDVDAHAETLKADPEYAESHANVLAAQKAVIDADDAVRAQVPVVRKAVVTDHVNTVAARMGYDPAQIDVVDIPPREFAVAGRQLNEGGHFDPRTGRIEVNARNTSDNEAYLPGLIAHEIMHAQQHTVEVAASMEHNEMRDLPKEEFDRLFGRSGWPRTTRIPELEARFPASAALAKGHPTGDTYFGTWSKYPDGRWAFDEAAHKSEGGREEQMQKDDGFTGYSKLYWEALGSASPAQSGHARQRAVGETLAEVSAYHERAPRGPWGENVPSKSWQKYGRLLREAYPKALAKQGKPS